MSSPYSSFLLPFVRKIESRSQLTSDERQAFLSLPCQVVQVRTHRVFMRQGEDRTYSSFVLEGVVGAFNQDRDGNRQIVSIFVDGDMADLHSAVMPRAQSAMQALTETTILQVSHSALLETARVYPHLGRAFWRESAIDAGIVKEWVVNVGRRNARTRMAHFFCELACRATPAGPQDGTIIRYPITQAHLSEILGLTAIHVNRTLRALRAEGLLQSFERSIERVANWAGLVTAGDFDPTYLQLDCGQAQAA